MAPQPCVSSGNCSFQPSGSQQANLPPGDTWLSPLREPTASSGWRPEVLLTAELCAAQPCCRGRAALASPAPRVYPVWHSSSRSCAHGALGSSRPPRHLASWDPQPRPLWAETARLLGVLRAEPGSSVWVGAGRLWAHSDGSRSQGCRPAFAGSSACEGWLACPLAS